MNMLTSVEKRKSTNFISPCFMVVCETLVSTKNLAARLFFNSVVA